MNLTEELKKTAEGFKARAPEEVQVQMQLAHDELVKQKIIDGARGVGSKFPGFNLLNQKNESREFQDLFEDNNFLVISFYRGGWCPYCNLELRALQSRKEEFKNLGASLVAVTPEKPDHSLSTSEKNELDFEVLSDIDSALSKDLGISFELPENLKPIYAQFGINIPEHNGENNFTLPVPATYLLDRQGEIHYAFLDIDYTVRANPDEVIEKLKELRA